MAHNKLPKYEASFRKVYNKYKNRAANRKQEFDIPPRIFKMLCEMNCYYCGQEPTITADHSRYNGAWAWNGLDRIDNTQGYVIDNVQPCCFMCNRIKSDMEEKDFLNHVSRIHAHLGLGGIKED